VSHLTVLAKKARLSLCIQTRHKQRERGREKGTGRDMERGRERERERERVKNLVLDGVDGIQATLP
jgi:hypothetical protein